MHDTIPPVLFYGGGRKKKKDFPKGAAVSTKFIGHLGVSDSTNGKAYYTKEHHRITIQLGCTFETTKRA